MSENPISHGHRLKPSEMLAAMTVELQYLRRDIDTDKADRQKEQAEVKGTIAKLCQQQEELNRALIKVKGGWYALMALGAFVSWIAGLWESVIRFFVSK